MHAEVNPQPDREPTTDTDDSRNRSARCRALADGKERADRVGPDEGVRALVLDCFVSLPIVIAGAAVGVQRL